MITPQARDVKPEIVNLGQRSVHGIRSDLSPYERVRIKRLDRAPRKCSCPECGKRVRRHDRYHHEFFDLGFDATVLVIANVGIYRCRCGRCFTCPLAEAPRQGGYSYRVRQKALECLVNDTMTLGQTQERLWRDYQVVVAMGTLHGWYVATGLALDMGPHERWAAENFSGVVCIDEVYDGACCVLVATDPLNNITIAHWIAERPDRCTDEDVLCLFGELNRILPHPPEVAITDGSTLYTRVITDTWPHVYHQLCYFHVVKDICGLVLKAVREVKDGIDSNATQIADALQGPYARCATRAGLDLESLPSDRALLARRRYLFVKNLGRLSKSESVLLKAMQHAYPELQIYRDFINDVYHIFARGVTERQARRRHQKLLGNAEYGEHARLVEAMKKLRPAVFEKLVCYLKYENVPRTNNHVEGVNRQFRKLQKVCYKRRRKDTIRAALNLLLIYRLRKHPLYDESYGPAIALPRRWAAS